MVLLGISDSHDAAVVIIQNGNIVCAVSEERFSRRKRQQGFPIHSLQYIKNTFTTKIDSVHVATKSGRALFRWCDTLYTNSPSLKNVLSPTSRLAYFYENIVASLPILRTIDEWLSRICLKRRLSALGFTFNELIFINHHVAHIVSSMHGLQSNHFIAVSLDAYGDGKSGLLIYCRDNKVIKKVEISYRNSIAMVYGTLTSYLGFTEGDEGKVMALAAYGHNTQCRSHFESLFSIQNGQLHVDHRFMKRKFQKLLSVFSKEDIAYALQETIEDVIIRLIKSILPDVDSDSHPDLFLAGGLFANVRVNQKLNQTGYFQNVFVNPCMNDGGTAFCALHRTNGEQYKTSRSITHMFLGPRYNDYQIRNVLNAFDVSYRYEKDIEATIADLLSQGYAVARFAGSMEFGPRALGNRSILCATNDVTVQKWLNEKLGRDDFMPFAAVTLDEYKNDCYTRLENASYLYPFMTSTFYCTSMMKIQSPNVVHVDETVRAQIVTKENNPSLYRILSLYYSKTNIPSLLNTSFNLHGEPIVCTPRDALNTFHTLKLDYLVMENYIIKN